MVELKEPVEMRPRQLLKRVRFRGRWTVCDNDAMYRWSRYCPKISAPRMGPCPAVVRMGREARSKGPSGVRTGPTRLAFASLKFQSGVFVVISVKRLPGTVICVALTKLKLIPFTYLPLKLK